MHENKIVGVFYIDIEDVCIGKQFIGGETYFCGRRCSNHTNSRTHEEVVYLSCNLSIVARFSKFPF
jgi:hypothetical protein